MSRAAGGLLIGCGVLGVSGVSSADVVQWALRSTSGPAARNGHAMAYDSRRGVTVLFGGLDQTPDLLFRYYADTWEWDGSSWLHREVPGPTARSGHAMAYDAARGVTVLFGGYNGYYSPETWEWDGVSWTNRGVPGPTGRSTHGMCYDSARGVTVLFGGVNSDATPVYSGETWGWDGAVWALRQGNGAGGPPGRGCQGMTYDAARGRSVIFGGYNNPAFYLSDTWEWDGTAWTARPTAGPNPRYYAPMAHDRYRGVDVLFGGLAAGGPMFSGQTWDWNGSSWVQRPVIGPSPRYAAAMVYESVRRGVLLFGGYNGSYQGDTWALAPVCAADFDGSGTVGVQDLFDFLRAWFAGAARADFNGSGFVTVQDIFDFLVAWFAGCQ